jgi:dolichyl-phosphate beta-glucosyltransferase
LTSHPLELSVIVPAFNEACRVGGFLIDAMQYLDATMPDVWELIVVDDGSADGTADVINRLAQDQPRLRLLRHPANIGKGAAVRTGVAASGGRRVLFADADGATPMAEERRLRRVIDAGADVAIGSRQARRMIGAPAGLAEADDPVVRTVHWHRFLIGRTFAFLANRLLGFRYLDTQCGFKMFRRDVARVLFSELTQLRFIFDAELLYLAARHSFHVVEVPVNWHDVAGSKVRLMRDSALMFAGMWKIRLAHRPRRR